MARAAIGVDVGGTRIKIGAVSAEGALGFHFSLPTPQTPDEVAALIAMAASRLRDRAGLPGDTPVGVAVPGVIDESAQVVELAVNLGWKDVPIGDHIASALGHRAVIGHDVRAGALAESSWGAGRMLRGRPGVRSTRLSAERSTDLVFVPIGTGIAAAVIHEGRIFGDRYTGEIGQVQVIEPFTGRTVRLEEVASASAIGRRYREHTGGDTTEGDPRGDRERAREVVDLARSGHVPAEEVVFSALDTLAQALASIISGVGPVPIVIGGGLAEGGDIIIEPLRHSIAPRLGSIPTPPIVPASLGRWAGCLGAGLLALREEAGR